MYFGTIFVLFLYTDVLFKSGLVYHRNIYISQTLWYKSHQFFTEYSTLSYIALGKVINMDFISVMYLSCHIWAFLPFITFFDIATNVGFLLFEVTLNLMYWPWMQLWFAVFFSTFSQLLFEIFFLLRIVRCRRNCMFSLFMFFIWKWNWLNRNFVYNYISASHDCVRPKIHLLMGLHFRKELWDICCLEYM